MKRIATLIVTFVVLFGLTGVSAQQKPTLSVLEQQVPKIDVPGIMLVTDVLADVAKRHKLKVSIEESLLTMDKAFIGQVPGGTVRSQVEFLAKYWGGEVSFPGGVSVVILKSTKTAPATKQPAAVPTPAPTPSPEATPKATPVAEPVGTPTPTPVPEPTPAVEIPAVAKETTSTPKRSRYESVLAKNGVGSDNAKVADLMARYPHAFNEDGSVGDFSQATALNREMFSARRIQEQTYAPVGTIGMNTPQTYSGGPGGNYGYGSAGRNWNGLPYFYDLIYTDQGRRMDHSWTTAKIKITGPSSKKDKAFLGRISVVALVRDNNGGTKQYVIIDATEANNFWDRDVVVPIQDHSVTLLFVMEDGSDRPKAFGRTLWLEPQAVRRGATPVVVTPDKLVNARDQYDLRRHLFIEGPNGEIK